MNAIILLHALKAVSIEAFADKRYPVARTERDKCQPEPRTPAIHLMSLPDMLSWQTKAPYIVHQIVTGEDRVSNRGSFDAVIARTTVRTIFCTYDKSSEEAGLLLAEMMETFRHAIWEPASVGGQFLLDRKIDPPQYATYPHSDGRTTAPYYMGEYVTTWVMPPLTIPEAEHIVSGGVGPYHVPAKVRTNHSDLEKERTT